MVIVAMVVVRLGAIRDKRRGIFSRVSKALGNSGSGRQRHIGRSAVGSTFFRHSWSRPALVLSLSKEMAGCLPFFLRMKGETLLRRSHSDS